jgi:pyruvate,orthophosphate dikinase
VKRLVYFFGNGKADGTREMKSVLGGKGANLAEMTNLGVPVPPGFTIACEVCIDYLRDGSISSALRDEVARNLERLETATGKHLGDPTNPLLVSVRSGSPVSMPGMMETILNLGLNNISVQGLAQQSGSARFAYDSYRRFLQMYGDVVLGVSIQDFESLLKGKRLLEGVTTDAELSEGALRNLVEEYKALIRTRIGDAQEGGRLSSRERDLRDPRDGGEHRRDGLREHGRRLGHRGRVHAQPVDG